jgi:hypothetical protein
MPMFRVHTESGKYIVQAKNPKDARDIVKRDMGEIATKVKLVGGEKREK